MPAVSARPYPWNALERVSRKAALRLVELRERPLGLAPERIAEVLTTLVGAPVELAVTGLGVGAPAERMSEIGLAWGATVVTLGVEPALATALLERILARPFSLPRPDAPLEPSVAGALAALGVEVARRIASEPVSVHAPLGASIDALYARANVYLDDRPYAAYALVSGTARPTTGAARPSLVELGELPLAVPLVVAVSLATRAELARLTPGAAFFPGEKAWITADRRGRGVLASGAGERGVGVDLTPDGRLVLRGETVELSPDSADSADDMADADDVNQTLTDAALDAPVVVRVELGAVSMSASDWAKLKAGDVIETGRRVAEPVLLRIAGRVVARGELVDVDGEVGVRVRELFGGKPER